WVAMPGDGRGREVRPAADVGDNLYKTDGVVHLLTSDQLPLDDVRHWKPSSKQGADSPLPELSFGPDCPAGAPQPHEIGGVRNQERATASFIGDRHSRARQRYIEYDQPADATVELDALRKALTSCGLKRHGKAPGAIYSGKDKDGQGILVQLDHGERWTSVLEVREVTQGMNPG
ncbi:hypothetical protein, partial [Streptomyces sp. MZ04]|uniref:hypothetical protein n=1 Tax=Streptomyces sp. MZ04 TaxID=2559236 RepID=UPI001AE0DDA5